MSSLSQSEHLAARWHLKSDHYQDGEPFGGPMCNCPRVAQRMMPFLAEAHDAGFYGRGENVYREVEE